MSGSIIAAGGTLDSGIRLSLDNAGSGTLAAGIASFGQCFAQGELPAGGLVQASIGGVAVQLQVDVKTTYDDGSAKFAVLSVARPELAAGASAELVLTRAATSATAPAIDLAGALAGHAFTVDLAMADGSLQQVDALAALRTALADGTASFWQHGALATEARVEVPLAGSMRLVFDIAAYAGGGYAVDVQFADDRAMEATGGGASYTATIRMDGAVVDSETVAQAQYQTWHAHFATAADGGQGLGDPTHGWLNIVQDVARLERIGAVADYDLSLTLSDSLLASYGSAIAAAGWGDPLAANGVTQYMPMSGGRADIGITTQANTAWLISQDPRAAAYALGQAEASGAVPWNFWNQASGTWLNLDDYPNLWVDPRGGTGKPGDAASTGLTQQVATDTGWTPDPAHQPDLASVAYLLTGERWALDRLEAQAAWNVVDVWQGYRDGSDIVVDGVQVRAAAWALREIDNAAWSAPDGSAEQAYFRAVSADNWAWLVAQIPRWTAMQGEAHGWLPGDYGSSGALPPWQQDYFASTAIAAASRGNQDALTFLNWEANFLIGRFTHAADGFAMHDGAAYVIAIADPSTGTPYSTWSAIGAATAARGWSNGDGWSQSNGDYGQLALATLAGIYDLTGSPDAAAAYKALLAEAPPFTSTADYAADPTFAVGLTGSAHTATLTGTAGNDSLAPTAALTGVVVDLGAGMDVLTLSSAGPNSVTVIGAETIYGGSLDDSVTLGSTADGAFIDLGSGADRLLLADAGPNLLTVSHAETILGGAGDDRVTLAAPVAALFADLGGGADILTLARGSNTVLVAGAETILGGGGEDHVTFAAPSAGTLVRLGGGTDSLQLADGGNTVRLGGVELVQGGAGRDSIALSGSTAAQLFGYGGADTLTGATGADRLVGGAGADRLTGGRGSDSFVYASAADSTPSAPDIIADFETGVDKLVFAGLLHGSFAWLRSGAFTAGGHTEARLDSAGLLQLDLGGDGVADMAIRLVGITPTSLAKSDFVWS